MKSSQLQRNSKSNLAEIRRLHGEIDSAARTSFKKAIRIGELLSAIKADLEHGEWLPWLTKNLPFLPRTAQNYMRVYEQRADFKNATDAHLGQAYRMLANAANAGKGANPKTLGAKADLGAPIVEVVSLPDEGTGELTTGHQKTPREIAVLSYRTASQVAFGFLSGEGVMEISPAGGYETDSYDRLFRGSIGFVFSKEAEKIVEAWKILERHDQISDIVGLIGCVKYGGEAVPPEFRACADKGVFAPNGNVRNSPFLGREPRAEDRQLFKSDHKSWVQLHNCPISEAPEFDSDEAPAFHYSEEAGLHYLAWMEAIIRALMDLPPIDDAIRTLAAELIAWFTSHESEPMPGYRAMRTIRRCFVPLLAAKKLAHKVESQGGEQSIESTAGAKTEVIKAPKSKGRMSPAQLEAAIETSIADAAQAIQAACEECRQLPDPDPSSAITTASKLATSFRRSATQWRKQLPVGDLQTHDGMLIENLLRYWETEIDYLLYLSRRANGMWAYDKDKGPGDVYLDQDEAAHCSSPAAETKKRSVKLKKVLVEAADHAFKILEAF